MLVVFRLFATVLLAAAAAASAPSCMHAYHSGTGRVVARQNYIINCYILDTLLPLFYVARASLLAHHMKPLGKMAVLLVRHYTVILRVLGFALRAGRAGTKRCCAGSGSLLAKAGIKFSLGRPDVFWKNATKRAGCGVV